MCFSFCLFSCYKNLPWGQKAIMSWPPASLHACRVRNEVNLSEAQIMERFIKVQADLYIRWLLSVDRFFILATYNISRWEACLQLLCVRRQCNSQSHGNGLVKVKQESTAHKTKMLPLKLSPKHTKCGFEGKGKVTNGKSAIKCKIWEVLLSRRYGHACTTLTCLLQFISTCSCDRSHWG